MQRKQLWREETIRSPRIHGTTFRQSRQEIHPKSMRQIPFSRTCHRPYSSLSHQHYRFTVCQSYHRHNETNATTPRLHSVAGRRRHYLSSQRNDLSRTQRRELFKRTQSTQPRWRPFLPFYFCRYSTKQRCHSKPCTHH